MNREAIESQILAVIGLIPEAAHLADVHIEQLLQAPVLEIHLGEEVPNHSGGAFSWLVLSGNMRRLSVGDESSLVGMGGILDLRDDGYRAADLDVMLLALPEQLSFLLKPSNAPVMISAEGEGADILALLESVLLVPAGTATQQSAAVKASLRPDWLQSGPDTLAASLVAGGRVSGLDIEYIHLSRIKSRRERLEKMCSRFGLHAERLIVTNPRELLAQRMPLILACPGDRYVVVYPDKGRRLAFYDAVSDSTVSLAIADLSPQMDCVFWRISAAAKKGKFGLGWFVPVVMRHGKLLRQVLMGSIVLQTLGLGTPMLTQVVIDKVMVHGGMQTLTVVGSGLLLIAVLETVLGIARSYILSHTANRIDLQLSGRVFQHLVSLPQRYFDTRRVGDTVARIRELHSIREFFTGTAISVVLDSLFTVIYLMVMFAYSVPLTLVTLGVLPLFIILTMVASPMIRRKLNTSFNHNSDVQSFLVEATSGIQGVKAHAAEVSAIRRWEGLYARYVQASLDAANVNNAAGYLAQGFTSLGALLVLWIGAYLVVDHTLTVGALIAFQMLSGRVTGPLIRLVQLWQNLQQVFLAIDRLGDVLNTPSEPGLEHGLVVQGMQGNIQFERTTFSYREDGQPSLDQVNFSIKSGEFVCAVGKTGSGKSTLSKMIQGLYLPDSGAVYVDGLDTRNLDPNCLREHIACVLQDDCLFNMSVMENIAFGNDGVMIEDVVEAARLADAHEFIVRLPLGYHTSIGERGMTLSGGQRQRLALARVFLSKAPIIILDEATSALDAETEQRVLKNIRSKLGQRTVFMVTHRFAPTFEANKILVMDDGKLAEEGTHRDLMLLRGRYYELFERQRVNI